MYSMTTDAIYDPAEIVQTMLEQTRILVDGMTSFFLTTTSVSPSSSSFTCLQAGHLYPVKECFMQFQQFLNILFDPKVYDHHSFTQQLGTGKEMGEVTSRILFHKNLVGPLKELGNRSIEQIL